MSPELILLKTLVVYYTLTSLVGLVINVWAYLDCRQDLKELYRANVNGKLERTAFISSRAARSTIATHLVFLSLGLINLFSGSGLRGNMGDQFIFGYVIVVCLLMTLIVTDQTLNQIDRVYIRHKYQEELANAER